MPQIKNRTVFTGDNLPILRAMNSGSVDLIYLDPPFNSRKQWSAPIGSRAAGAAFKDAWTFEDTDDAWHGLIADEHPALYKIIDAAGSIGGKGDKAYLIYMAMRILELRRVLKDRGSVYLHCDTTMSHSLKMVMDAIFGGKNFRNEVLWCYTGPSNTKRYYPRKHDCLLFYVKDRKENYTFSPDSVRIPYAGLNQGGNKFGAGLEKSNIGDYIDKGKIPEDWWEEKRDGMTPVGRLKRERTGYPTQKPLALLERIVKASSNKGDMVLDPFCGCATACIAAEKYLRHWIGIDISPKAIELVKYRVQNDLQFPALWAGKIITRDDIPKRTDKGKIVPGKDIKHILFGKQRGICNGCGHAFPFQNFTKDHIMPKAAGGADSNDNLQLLCGHCNSVKNKGTMAELKARLKARGITA